MNEIDEMCQGQTLKTLHNIKKNLLAQGESEGGNIIGIVNEHINDMEMYAVRQVVSYIKKEPPVIELKNLFNLTGTDSIIVYVTKGNKGLGILQSKPQKNSYGFMYHSDVITGNHSKYTYVADSHSSCIDLALKANRKVYVFSSFQEFLSFAADHDKY